MLVCDEKAETVFKLDHTDERSLEINFVDKPFGEDGMIVVWSEVVDIICVDMVASDVVINSVSVLRVIEVGSGLLNAVVLCSASSLVNVVVSWSVIGN